MLPNQKSCQDSRSRGNKTRESFVLGIDLGVNGSLSFWRRAQRAKAKSDTPNNPTRVRKTQSDSGVSIRSPSIILAMKRQFALR